MNTLVIDAGVWASAADATDALSQVSRTFLSGVVARELPIALPDFARLEIACALARRLRDAEQGRRLTERMLASPLVTTYSLSRAKLREAVEVGTGSLLCSGAAALYAALAEGLDGTLVAWDAELARWAGTLTPQDWIEGHVPVI